MTDKTKWGNALWTFLHVTASKLDDPEAFIDQLRLLPRILPCPDCRSHAREHISKYPPENYISNIADASAYMFVFHNLVNLRCSPPKTLFSLPAYERIYGPLNLSKVPQSLMSIDEKTEITKKYKRENRPFKARRIRAAPPVETLKIEESTYFRPKIIWRRRHHRNQNRLPGSSSHLE